MKKYLLGLALLFLLSPVHAQEGDFIEGGNYELLDEVQPVQTGDKIEVVEMFWYRCPHCYRLEPYLEQWLPNKPDNAEFVPIPAILNKNWEFHARVFYTFEALGYLDQLHGKYFDAIHKERQPLDTVEQLSEWVTSQGLDASAIPGTFNSFAVNNKINFANIMTRKYGISGVPSIIVDGKFRTSVSMAGGHDALMDLINYLVERAAMERSS